MSYKSEISLLGIISEVALSFMVQEPKGIMDKVNPMS